MTAVIALGANLGDRLGTLQAALHELAAAGPQVIAVSRVYETAPVGGPEQPSYLNAVVIVTGEPEPHALLALLHEIEQAHGRTREVRWGARTLDLDVIAVVDMHGDGVRSDDPDLTLPHPRAHERSFVLVPWLDADPNAVLDVDGTSAQPVAALLDALGRDAPNDNGVWPADGMLHLPDARPTVGS